MNRIIKYVVLDILKNRILLAYAGLLALFSWTAFSLEDNSAKGVLTLLNLMLLTVPLVSILFSTIYIYNSAEFVELLVSQPIRRTKIWTALFAGLSVSLGLAFLVGMGIPVMIFVDTPLAIILLGTGVLTTLIFVSIAFLGSILSRDKARGIGIAILLWLFFALLFDGLVLFLLFQFAEYPIERAMIGVSMASPIDLARILIMLQLDVSAMMGYTGAIFKEFFGTRTGLLVSFGVLGLWVLVPYLFSLRLFKTRDL
jgi:Cu-processing system permease protein